MMGGQRRSVASCGRIFARRVHLWLGFSLGLLFALLGLTGSALVFYTPIDAALHPAIWAERNVHQSGEDPTAFDRVLAEGGVRYHDPQGKWTLEVTEAGRTIPARYYPTPDGRGERRMVWFSADGSRILRDERWGSYLMSWIYELHMQLLVGKSGRRIVGWSGAAILLLLVSGMVVWWPRGSLRKALAFKRDAVPIRRARDLHKLGGLWSIAASLILVTTGVLLALPEITHAAFHPAPLHVPSAKVLPANERDLSMAVALALAAAHRAIPDGNATFVDVPNSRDEPIRVRLRVPDDPQHRFAGSYVFVVQGSAQALAVHDMRRVPGGGVASWVRVLHDGSLGGSTTRVLTVLFGLAPSLLLATGFLHRRRRRTSLGAALAAVGN